jgi:MFS family permease
MNKNLKFYMLLNGITSYSFITIILAPMYASKMGLTLLNVSIKFSISYAVQTILTFWLGKYFENKSPNKGLALGRLFYAVGNIIFAITSNSIEFLMAQLFINATETFFPLISMYERGITSPDNRHKFYQSLIIVSELTKVSIFIPIVLFLNLKSSPIFFYKSIFISVFLLNIVYSVAMLKGKFVPFVKTGSTLHEEQDKSHTPNFKKYIFVTLSQSVIFSTFSFGSYLVISYFVKNYFSGNAKTMIIYEIVYSLTVLSSIFWKKLLKPNIYFFTLGVVFISLFYLTLAFTTNFVFFYLSHIFLAIGIVMWYTTKEPLKQKYAPKKFGRWEGFFSSISMVSKIFLPFLAGLVATNFSYSLVFIISFFIIISMAIVSYFGIKD